MLAEHPFKTEPQALGCVLGPRVAVVALPLQPTVALLERILGQQVHRFGAFRRALHRCAEGDVADFDTALRRDDGHQAEDALNLARRTVDHAEKVRVAVGGVIVQPGVEGTALGERAVGQVIPQLRIGPWAVKGLPQLIGMARRVELFQVDKTPFKQVRGGRRGAFPVGEGSSHAALLRDLCEIE